MTTSKASTRGGCSGTGDASKQANSSLGTMREETRNPEHPTKPAGSTGIDELVAEFEADPEMAPLLAEARRAIAHEWYSDGAPTLARLRLEAGLSQAQLAGRVATSQSHVARIELGQVDPSTDLIARIATALAVDATLVFAAIRAQRAAGQAALE